jgi:hypothetical protein
MLSYFITNLQLTWLLLKEPGKYWPVALDETSSARKLYLQFLFPLVILPAILITTDGAIHQEPLAGARGAIVYLILRLLFVFLSAKLIAVLFKSTPERQMHKVMVFAVIPLILSDLVYKILEIIAPVFLTILAVPLLLGGLIPLLILYASGVQHAHPDNTLKTSLRYAGAAEIIILYFVLGFFDSYINNLFFHFVK